MYAVHVVVSAYVDKQDFGLVSKHSQETIVEKVGPTYSKMKIKNETTYAFVRQLKSIVKTSVILDIFKGLCWLEKPCGIDPAG